MLIIQRVVPRSRRVAFESAFFRDLEQQPLGPTVVVSVRVFLDRVEGLETVASEDAQAVREALAERGLTKSVVAQQRELIKKAEGELKEDYSETAQALSRVAAAQTAQREAVEDFRDFFRDWATTFRTAGASVNQLIILGLAVSKSGKKSDPDLEEPEVDDGEEVDEEESGETDASDAGVAANA